jgi:hypothetical protein
MSEGIQHWPLFLERKQWKAPPVWMCFHTTGIICFMTLTSTPSYMTADTTKQGVTSSATIVHRQSEAWRWERQQHPVTWAVSKCQNSTVISTHSCGWRSLVWQWLWLWKLEQNLCSHKKVLLEPDACLPESRFNMPCWNQLCLTEVASLRRQPQSTQGHRVWQVMASLIRQKSFLT